jgi:uncharacterized protein
MLMAIMFVGRIQELEILHREYDRSRPSLLVVLGRRRVGKSTLLLKSVESRQHIYYQASKLTDLDNQILFKQVIKAELGSDPILDSLNDWDGLFSYLQQVAENKRPGLTVILDEFPYLCEAQPGLPSILQRAWDRIQAKASPINLVLCGSKISFMEELLAERNPLRGRQTVELDVAPLTYRDAASCFPNWSPIEQLYAYGVFGGMPYYLSLCDPSVSLSTNIREVILDRGAALHDEPNLLLQAELTSVSRYASTLRAIADGCTEWGDILGRIRDIKDGGQLGPYVKKLEGLRLVQIVRSLDADERQRQRRYYLDDPFLFFWYRFVLPNRSALESGHAQVVYERMIEPFLDDYMGGIFERVCQEYMRWYGQELLEVPAQEVGRIWTGDFDIDVAGKLLDGSAFYGECKWWKNPVGENVLDHLIETSAKTAYGREKDSTPRHYIIFARQGFTTDLQARAVANPQIHLVTPEKLLDIAAN